MGSFSRKRVAIPGAAVTGCLVGLLIAHGWTVPLLAAVVAAGGATFLVRSPGWALGVWVLAVTNTIPGYNLDRLHVPGYFQPYDGLMVVLCAAAAYAAVTLPAGELARRVPRWLALAVVVLVAWWLFALLRTWLLDGVPVRPAALFGRDLLYGGVAAGSGAVLLRDRRDVVRALNAMMLGAAVYALAFVPHVLLGVGAGWIVHPYLQASSDGLTRLYQPSNDLVAAVLPIALWLALGGRGRSRVVYGCAAGLFALQVALQQTRATYIGLVLSLCLATALVLVAPSLRHLRAAALAAWGALAAAVLALALAAVSFAGSGSALVVNDNAVYRRIASIPATLRGSSGGGSSASWTYRLQLAGRLVRLLGHDFLWGLGFISPAYHYFAGLPGGNIRSSDVGALGTVMVIGVVGLVLVLAPFVGSGVVLLRASLADAEDPPDAALVVGLVAFLVGTLFSSVTLVTLFLATGPAMSGLLAGCCVALGRRPAVAVGAPAGRIPVRSAA